MTDVEATTIATNGSPAPDEPHDSSVDRTPRAAETDAAVEMLAAIRGGRRRRWLGTLAAFAVGALTGAVLWSATGGKNSENVVKAPVALTNVVAEQRDLATFVDFDATLGFAQSQPLTVKLTGAVTAIAGSGVDVERGGVIVAVDAVPVVLFYGDLPLWRDLSVGVSDGRDVAEVEANLFALGYTRDLGDGFGPRLTVNGNYDANTAAAVQQWETDLGVAAPDGVFETSHVVLLPGKVRVDQPLALGSPVRESTALLTATVTEHVTDVVDQTTAQVTGQQRSSTERVSAAVPTSDQGRFPVGKAVTIELADGRSVAGAVSSIGQVARRTGQGNNAQYVVDVLFDVTAQQPATPLLAGPVTVHVADEEAKGVVAVPVRALVALAEGGYAVEVASGSGSTLVGVTTGLFVDGWVQVTGKVSAGDQIVVPS